MYIRQSYLIMMKIVISFIFVISKYYKTSMETWTFWNMCKEKLDLKNW